MYYETKLNNTEGKKVAYLYQANSIQQVINNVLNSNPIDESDILSIKQSSISEAIDEPRERTVVYKAKFTSGFDEETKKKGSPTYVICFAQSISEATEIFTAYAETTNGKSLDSVSQMKAEFVDLIA